MSDKVRKAIAERLDNLRRQQQPPRRKDKEPSKAEEKRSS